MGTASPVQKAESVEQKTGAVQDFRIIPRIETWPRVVSFVQTIPGKVALLAAFAIGLRYFVQAGELVLMAPIAIITFLPEYRRFILAVAPIAIVFASAGSLLSKGVTLAVIVAGMLLYLCAMRWPKSRFARRPILFTLSGFTALIALACLAPPHWRFYGAVWTLVEASASYVWFICYALIDRSSKPGKDTTLELAAFRPLWGSTSTPFPKGAAYLRRIEAKTPEQFAVTQLKGLKLLVWAIILAEFAKQWDWWFHGRLHIPTAAQALAMSVQGHPAAWHLRWESLVLFFFESILSMSVMGHRIIAVCRVAGFNALRNTYKPLYSITIMDFFNRYYYYFKELLVDFFFYPAFFRYFKGRRRLRIAFATFAAAFFGNAYYHFMNAWQVIRDAGMWHAATSFEAYLVYSFLLSTGLTISQLRQHRAKAAGVLRSQVLPCCGVALFYCLINVFEIGERDVTLHAYAKYFASLFFIRP